MNALASLSLRHTLTLNWSALLAAVPGLQNPPGNANVLTPIIKLGTKAANNLALGADTLLLAVSTIAPSATLTTNLQSYVDAAGQSGAGMVRLKSYAFILFNSAYDSAVVTPATSITIQGHAASHPFNFNWVGTTPGVILLPGEPLSWATPNPAGITVSSTVCNFDVVNNDSVNAAIVFMLLAGGTN